MKIDEAAVVLHLHVRVKQENHEAFWQYIRDAFPVFEAAGDCKGMVYVNVDDPESLDEVFYYSSDAAYQAGERAIRENKAQIALLARWRTLLDGPPRVVVQRRMTVPEG